jgi:hypothetical protein
MLLRTLDGKALIIEKIADPFEKRHIVRAIIPASSTALQWPQGRKLGFPESQNMRRNFQMLRYLRDCPERVI